MNPTKGEIINFTTKTSGLFEIIEPVMEGDELFDANLLEQTVNSLIEEGKRNFAIDLSKIDYLYSDSINKFINLNHKVLNVYGRLTLLAPAEQVSKILQRAGIQNFLKIYSNIDELKKASDEIIQQTTSISINDIKSFKSEKLKSDSEFEDFRSEIGKAIDGTPDGGPGIANYIQPDQALPQSAPEPPQQDYRTSESDYKKRDDHSKDPQNYQHFTPPPFQPPPQPRFDYSQLPNISSFEIPEQPVQYQHPESSPPSDHKLSQNYSPESMQPQYDQGLPPGPPLREEYKKTQRIPTTKGMEQAPPSQSAPTQRTYDQDDFFDDEEDTKQFPIIPVIASLAGIIIIIIGFILFFKPFGNAPGISLQKKEQSISPSVPQSEPIIPEIQSTDSEEGKTVAQPPQISESEPEPDREPIIKKVRKKTVSISKKVDEEAPEPETKKTTNRIVITSYPSRATVYNNDVELGVTPYTWRNPSVYGMVVISVEKDGFLPKNINFEFVGGIEKKHVVLIKKPNAPPPKKIVSRPEPEPEPEPISEPEPDFDIDEPEPFVESTPPSAPEPVKTVASAKNSDDGTIFISSLPPMADVYMDGKKIGKTNIAELKITAGTHLMKFVKGPKQIEKKMTFTAGKNPSQLIRLK